MACGGICCGWCICRGWCVCCGWCVACRGRSIVVGTQHIGSHIASGPCTSLLMSNMTYQKLFFWFLDSRVSSTMHQCWTRLKRFVLLDLLSRLYDVDLQGILVLALLPAAHADIAKQLCPTGPTSGTIPIHPTTTCHLSALQSPVEPCSEQRNSKTSGSQISPSLSPNHAATLRSEHPSLQVSPFLHSTSRSP